MLDNII